MALDQHQRFFDVWSRFYRVGPLGRELRAAMESAVKRLGALPGQRVLDLGCGHGDAVGLLVDAGVHAVGVDTSAGMLGKARPAVRGRLVRADAAHLPFPSGRFHGALCTNSFHHYPEPFEALRELRRVLAPGARVVLTDPRLDNIFGWAAIELMEKAVFGLDEVHVWSPAGWRQALGLCGFDVVSITTGPPWRPVAWAEVVVVAEARREAA